MISPSSDSLLLSLSSMISTVSFGWGLLVFNTSMKFSCHLLHTSSSLVSISDVPCLLFIMSTCFGLGIAPFSCSLVGSLYLSLPHCIFCFLSNVICPFSPIIPETGVYSFFYPLVLCFLLWSLLAWFCTIDLSLLICSSILNLPPAVDTNPALSWLPFVT